MMYFDISRVHIAILRNGVYLSVDKKYYQQRHGYMHSGDIL